MSRWNLDHPALCACSPCHYAAFLHQFVYCSRAVGHDGVHVAHGRGGAGGVAMFLWREHDASYPLDMSRAT